MPEFFLAPALVTLRNEVNKRYPKRDKSSDGWIGDPSHAARISDHNPCWSCTGKSRGIVRALDIDISPDGRPDANLAAEVLKATIGDARVWYVIHRGKIYSRTHGWQARVYAGAPHDQHVHVSLNGANGLPGTLNFSTASWHLGESAVKETRLPAVSLSGTQNAARHPRRATNPTSVRRVQRALNARGNRLTVDGIYGPATRAAYRRWQVRLGYTGTDADGIPGLRSLTRLGLTRFRVIK